MVEQTSCVWHPLLWLDHVLQRSEWRLRNLELTVAAEGG
jgi:hypothetical protein